jgi:hypothetical protein
VFNFLFQINHHIAWRFIFSAILFSPFILIVIAQRGKFSPRLRSFLLGVCFFGLLLPYQRSAIYSFDALYLFLRHIAEAGLQIPTLTGDELPYDIFQLISVVWLIGFLTFSLIRILDYRKTIRMFREGKLQTSAAYFHRFRSRIYLPPHFSSTFTPEEQEMILAHERQHIAQHDPLLYRLLVILECVCWFNPLVSIAVRQFQQERELLCDERVTSRYPKCDYGLMLLKAEKEKKTAVRAATAGIVIEFGSTSERLSSIVEPVKTAGKITAAGLILLAILQLSFGFNGFRPAWRSFREYSPAIVVDELGLRELTVHHIEGPEALLGMGPVVEGLEAFVSTTKDGMTVDEEGMYRRAVSLGLSEKDYLRVEHFESMSLNMGGGSVSRMVLEFTVGDLKTKEFYLDYTKEFDFFVMLTDIFV